MKTPKYSAECRRGDHALCGGQRFIGHDKHGRRQYSRCKCHCHDRWGR